MKKNDRVLREGYCCDCANKPEVSLSEASKISGNKCNGCWCSVVKSNWNPRYGRQYYAEDGTLMNGDGSRSIFDDVDE